MRLIDTTTLSLITVTSSWGLEWAILSHTWGEDETTFTDFTNPSKNSTAGFRKIERACALAKWLGHKYIWIDTCCIDKSSSAELSEAINSMYNWYLFATVCIVYLADVKVLRGYEGGGDGDGGDGKEFEERFRGSRWFTRGWTLQELLAPKELSFYNRKWEFVGTKYQLRHLISAATRIPKEHLSGQFKPLDASAAQIMSWSAQRQTTREEDWAYSLMGLLNVNMPLLYGEGELKAFHRLQLEFIRDSSDESIFAWSGSANEASRAMFAQSPYNFLRSGDIVVADIYPLMQRAPYSYTNKGLQFEIRRLKSDTQDALYHMENPYYDKDPFYRTRYLVPLNCKRQGSKNTAITVALHHVRTFPLEANFVMRGGSDSLGYLQLEAPEVQAVVSKTVLVVGHAELGRMKTRYQELADGSVRFDDATVLRFSNDELNRRVLE